MESTKDEWYTGPEIIVGCLIKNETEEYNIIVMEKEWTKNDPKYDKSFHWWQVYLS